MRQNITINLYISTIITLPILKIKLSIVKAVKNLFYHLNTCNHFTLKLI
jgi:hypothetical protein